MQIQRGERGNEHFFEPQPALYVLTLRKSSSVRPEIFFYSLGRRALKRAPHIGRYGHSWPQWGDFGLLVALAAALCN